VDRDHYRVRTEREHLAGRIFAGRLVFSTWGCGSDVVWQAGAAFAKRVVEPQEHSGLFKRTSPENGIDHVCGST